MDITIFSTTNCGICHSLMQWLDKNGVPYTKKVIDEDPTAMGDFMQVNDGMIGTPFTVVQDGNETIKISGFDQGKFKDIVARYKG